MNIELSIKHQKIAGTYYSNQEVKKLRATGMTFAEIGFYFGITRQRVHQICQRPSENHHPKKRRWWKGIIFWR